MTTNWAAFHTAEPALAATVEARFALQASYVKEVEPPEPFHLFHVELTDVTRTFVEDETYGSPLLQQRGPASHFTPTRWCPAASKSRPVPPC